MNYTTDFLKDYEDKRRLPIGLPIFARLDGKSFHTFTKNCVRPYDAGIGNLMVHVAEFMARETNALAAYTQSDEITLTWNPQGDTEPIFGGKVQKIASVLASMASVEFNFEAPYHLYPDSVILPALFDCRVYTVPDVYTAGDVFLWRYEDAVKNSISMAAQHHYSPKQLHKKNSFEKKEMLRAIGVPWESYPNHFKSGTYIKGEHIARKFTADEIDKLPEKHEARINPDLMIDRLEYKQYPARPGGISFREWIYGG